MDRIKELLGKGFFPVQLPPGFTSKTLAAKYKKIQGKWEAQKQIDTQIEKFSVARSSYYRRVTSIVNPINFFFLVRDIDRYWSKIQLHYRKSKLSLSIPKIDPSLRAIKISKFSDLYEAKITRSTGYRFVLVTDISSYFPTIYTHTVPWALHSKQVAKKTKSKTDDFFGNILDNRCMGLQDRQTIGLPIGPDTSHIIAEIIGVAIDLQLRNSLGRWPAGFRYVDDFYLFFDSRDDAEKALAELTKAVSTYELQINPAKTKIIEVKELVAESWKYNLKKLDVARNRRTQRDDIHNYFEVLFSLEKRFSDESLVKYGLKQISSHIIRSSNWSVFEAYLLKCGYSFPNTLQVVANIITTYHHHEYKLSLDAIERFCNTLISIHAVSDHHSEVSWLLWICKELKLNLKREAVRAVEGMGNSICALILLDMYHSGTVKINLKADFLSQFSNSEALYGSNWLLAYEAGRRCWLKNSDSSFISNNSFFKVLLDNEVGFYDEAIKCNLIFDFKVDEEVDDLEKFFDRDDAIESHFNFDENDEEYFDSNGVAKDDDDDDDSDDYMTEWDDDM
nr:RNA-directed DNA polymerase [uncultured Pseudomonas sp.]